MSKEQLQELEEDIDRLNRALHYQLTQENILNEKNRKLGKQNKRYREAISYVMEAKSSHYNNNLDNALDDIKFTINETLKGRD